VTATFIYLMIALKIPIVGLLYIVWWAIKQEPEPVPEPGGDGGQREQPRHPRPSRGPRPRRDPHGAPPLPAPPRVRSVTARGRELAREHDRQGS
jgi:hypothetical protein